VREGFQNLGMTRERERSGDTGENEEGAINIETKSE
jgi:hypothetical protein